MRIKKTDERTRYTKKQKRCLTGKVLYKTYKKAIKAAQRNAAIAMKLGLAAADNIYLCRFCGGWHTTRQEPRNGGSDDDEDDD